MLAEHDIYLEIGEKKVFAVAIRWPGWCRQGRDEGSAIQALFQAGPRYGLVLESTGLAFKAPELSADLHIVERVKGNATTNFGAPGSLIASDREPIDAGELQRLEMVMKACWQTFDKAVRVADGRQLRKGPRGGGREVAGIIEHVVGADLSYLSSLGWKAKTIAGERTDQTLNRVQGEIQSGLQAAWSGQLPEEGPRGGKRWPLPYYVRRAAWHVIDHAWEIEDKIIDVDTTEHV